MYIKKNGKIVIEVIVIIYLLMVVMTAYSKLVVNSISKSKYYYIKDDILTLSCNENEVLMEFARYVNDEKDIKDTFLNNFNELSFIYTYSLDSNFYIEVKEGKIYLIENKGSNNRYREIKFKKAEDEETYYLDFIPTIYLTDYIKVR